jgi:hypothetical protein
MVRLPYMHISAIAVSIALLLFASSSGMMEHDDIESRVRYNLPGGYAPIPNLQGDRVQAAALFAVKTLLMLQENSSGEDASTATAAQKNPHFSFAAQLTENLRVTVARGSRQVVAGMNYDLVVVLSQPTFMEDHAKSARTASSTANGDASGVAIVGAFEVTIYDRFGDLSVTKWGQEFSLSDAKALLENENASADDSEWKD